MKKLNNRFKEFEDAGQELKVKNEALEARVNDLEFRSLRENLLFHGILEMPKEDGEALVKQFIAEKLEIVQDIIIDRAHKLYTDRELIRPKAAEKSELLKTIKQGVGVQQTKAVLQRRRDLSAAYDSETAAGKTVEWAGAKLMVREGNVGEFYEVKEQVEQEEQRIVAWNINGLLRKLHDNCRAVKQRTRSV